MTTMPRSQIKRVPEDFFFFSKCRACTFQFRKTPGGDRPDIGRLLDGSRTNTCRTSCCPGAERSTYDLCYHLSLQTVKHSLQTEVSTKSMRVLNFAFQRERENEEDEGLTDFLALRVPSPL